MDILADIQRWYNAQCDGDWEHSFGLSIQTLDNPGWSVTVDLKDTLLEYQPFEPVRQENERGVWLTCSVEEGTFRGMGDPSQLSRVLEIFLNWAKTIPNWLAIPEIDQGAIQAAEDQDFLLRLGEEIGPELCRTEGCPHSRIVHSVFCRRHHFEAIKRRTYPLTPYLT